MRLRSIENPSGIFLKIAYWFSKKQFGKVLTPMKIHLRTKARTAQIFDENNKV